MAVQNARAYRALAETNRELREARDRLVEAERLAAVGELSAAVAHGIRNPVAGIKTAAEFGVRDDRSRRIRCAQSFLDILTEADALDSRIAELLDFARPFVPHPALGGSQRDRARPRAPAAAPDRGAAHRRRRSISRRRCRAHELDAAQIEQVGLALVTNAIESMDAGGAVDLPRR